MNDKCPNCGFIIVENTNPSNVLKILKNHKNKNEDKNYPILVADFYCKKCKNSIHLKWADLDKEVKINKCGKCGEKLCASIFLGLMKGFSLQTFCFKCLKKINSGDFAFQK